MPRTKKEWNSVYSSLCYPAVPRLRHCRELGSMASSQRLSLSRTKMLKYSFHMWSFRCRTSGSFVLQPGGESLAKRLSARSWRGWAVSETRSSYDSPLPQSVNFSLLLLRPAPLLTLTPTYFQICSITVTFKPNLLHVQGAEKTDTGSRGSTEKCSDRKGKAILCNSG